MIGPFGRDGEVVGPEFCQAFMRRSFGRTFGPRRCILPAMGGRSREATNWVPPSIAIGCCPVSGSSAFSHGVSCRGPPSSVQGRCSPRGIGMSRRTYRGSRWPWSRGRATAISARHQKWVVSLARHVGDSANAGYLPLTRGYFRGYIILLTGRNAQVWPFLSDMCPDLFRAPGHGVLAGRRSHHAAVAR